MIAIEFDTEVITRYWLCPECERDNVSEDSDIPTCTECETTFKWMKKYMVHSKYEAGFDDNYETIEANNDFHAICLMVLEESEIHKIKKKLIEDYSFSDPFDEEAITKYFSMNNGDGCPYVTIMNIETDEIIYGGK